MNQTRRDIVAFVRERGKASIKEVRAALSRTHPDRSFKYWGDALWDLAAQHRLLCVGRGVYAPAPELGGVTDRQEVRIGYVEQYSPGQAYEAFDADGRLLGFADDKRTAVLMVHCLSPLSELPKFEPQDYRT